MLRQWLVKLEWYSTLFPRIPVPIQKELDIKMRSRPTAATQLQGYGDRGREPEHIPDEEVTFGEAERAAQSQRGRGGGNNRRDDYRNGHSSRRSPPRQGSPPVKRGSSPVRRGSPAVRRGSPPIRRPSPSRRSPRRSPPPRSRASPPRS